LKIGTCWPALGLLATSLSAAQAAPAARPPESQDAPPIVRPVVGQPAPEPALAQWLDAEPDREGATRASSVNVRGMIPTSRRAHTLAELADHVVIVHTFSWSDEAANRLALPLVRDLLAANSDRRIAGIGIADGLALEAARSAAKSAGLEHPIAIEELSTSRCPYVDLAARAACSAFVVGRGGGLLWQGNPATEQAAFLAAVERALALHPVLRLERALREALGKALGEYYAGRLSKAVALAQSARKAAEKSEDPVLLADAERMESHARGTQLAWMRELGEIAVRKDALAYVLLGRACQAAFARGEVQTDLEELERAMHKDRFFETRVLEVQKYVALQDERPPFFPVRRDAAGDRFAARLEGFLRSTSNANDETRTARDLVDRYRLTAR
jgi:hypothetical protein